MYALARTADSIATYLQKSNKTNFYEKIACAGNSNCRRSICCCL